MDTIDEVHVAPLGYERDRIERPVLEYDADVLYLLEDEIHELHTDYHDEMIASLRAEGIEVRFEVADLQDLYDVLAVVTTIAADHADDIVRVNVSSGPKLADIGSAVACMATDATAYHVREEEQAHPVDETPMTRGMADAEALPSYPIETISRDQVAVLDYVDEQNTETYTVKKKDLIEFAEEADLEFMVQANPANDKAKFALLNANIVEPLTEDSYIQVEDVGRQKQITLTETGRNALHAFRHKLRHG